MFHRCAGVGPLPGPRGWGLLAVCLGLLGSTSLARAADVEVRDFQVFVDGKPAGDTHMTFQRHDDGTVIMSAETDVNITIFVYKYKYTYRGREVWKDGRLQHFESTCTDDGKHFTVTAAAEHEQLRVRVDKRPGGNEEKLVRGDVWLTSYWNKPDVKHHNQTLSILDADTAKELSGQLLHVGQEQRSVAGQMQPVQHYRLTGKVNIELWYDGHNRLVRQEFVEQGHRTVVELTRMRR